MLFVYIIVPVGVLVSALVSWSAGSSFESIGDGQGYQLFREIALKNWRCLYFFLMLFCILSLISALLLFSNAFFMLCLSVINT